MKRPQILIVLAPSLFQDNEFFQARVMLVSGGYDTVTAVTGNKEEVTGVDGGKARVDVNLYKIKANNEKFEAIVFIGGTGAEEYFEDKKIHQIIKGFVQRNKLVAGICSGPVILAHAGVLSGKRATCLPEYSLLLEKNGAEYINEPVVVDGKIVTAQKPSDAAKFGRMISEVLSK